MGFLRTSLSFINKTSSFLRSKPASKNISEDLYSYAKKHINGIENDAIRVSLFDRFNYYSNQTNKKSVQRLVQIDDITHKLEHCKNNKILDYIEKELQVKKDGDTLNYIESILDALNCANNKYTPLYSLDTQLNAIKKKNILLFNITLN